MEIVLTVEWSNLNPTVTSSKRDMEQVEPIGTPERKHCGSNIKLFYLQLQ